MATTASDNPFYGINQIKFFVYEDNGFLSKKSITSFFAFRFSAGIHSAKIPLEARHITSSLSRG